MRYCKKCLEPSTRLGAVFSSSGICSTCTYHDKHKDNHNEREKEEILKNLFKKYPKKKGNFFDCILGVSGGSDSTRLALWLKEKFKINPLLVCCTYPPEQLTELGASNLSNLINLGFDVLVTSPSPQSWKKFLKEGFISGNYLRSPELALYSSLPQVAINYGINLIFWGEGGTAKNFNKEIINPKEEYDANNLRKSNTLKNCDTKWMECLVTDKAKIIPYKFPSEKKFKKNNIQTIYLGWFWKSHSFTRTPKYSTLYGMGIRKDRASNTGDLYGIKALDEDWVIINQMIKYLKYGHGRATDYLNYEIRYKNISRNEAIKLVEKYDGVCHKKYIKNFCDYIDISESEFWKYVSKFVNKKLFLINNNKSGKKYIPKFKVGEGL